MRRELRSAWPWLAAELAQGVLLNGICSFILPIAIHIEFLSYIRFEYFGLK
jgi:hypothetical protein